MSSAYIFKCGCRFPVENGKIKFSVSDIYNLPFNCPETWKLYEKGLTGAIFQLETELGKTWCRELQPNTIEHIAGLGAALRPSCLNARDEAGVNLTKHYVERKHGREEIIYLHPSLEKYYKETYGIGLFQEQVMSLLQELAGFKLTEAYHFIKGIAKKKAEIVSAMKTKFFDGCKKLGRVDEKQIEEIWGWLSASVRYGFNKSHAISYGLLSYATAYMKVHFPLAFFTAKLKGAQNKMDTEYHIKELVNDSKLFNIDVILPDIRDRQAFVHTDGKVIKFGICDIKGIGEAVYKKIEEVLNQVDLNNKGFVEAYMDGLHNITESVLLRMIEAGAFDYLKESRTKLTREAKILCSLTPKEFETASQVYKEFRPNNLKDLLLELLKRGNVKGSKIRLTRQEVIKSELQMYEGQDLKDSELWIAYLEESLLGVSLSYKQIDSCETSMVNTTCKEFFNGKDGFMIVAGDISDVKEKTISKGKNAGQKFLNFMLDDGTYRCKVVAWPDVLESTQGVIVDGNSVICEVVRPYKKNSPDMIMKKIWQAVHKENF